jgi:hypothetical protein
MSLTDWNWRLEADPQDVPWDCSATSVAWCLRTIGLPWSELTTVESMHPEYLSATYGLLDASGAGLVEWLASVGVIAENNPSASFEDVMAAAGHQPMVIGGRYWCHWVAVRMGSLAIGRPDLGALALMNPAPGYMGIGQVLEKDDFDVLGPFSAVWFTDW